MEHEPWSAGRRAPPSKEPSTQATAEIERQFDARNGGWGTAPKFPQPMTIEYLLRRAAATGDDRPRRSPGGASTRWPPAASATSSAAASIATHRPPIWLVPHFEQMLYDNAQLARATSMPGGDRRRRYREVAEGTLDYLLRELRRDDGTFAASQDADTDGEEGGTFVWSAAEIREVLGDDATEFARPTT